MREVDELVSQDTIAQDRAPYFARIVELAAVCFISMAVGSGARRLYEVRGLLKVGAAIVELIIEVVDNPTQVESGAALFVLCFIVVGIDALPAYDDRADGSLRWKVMAHCGMWPSGSIRALCVRDGTPPRRLSHSRIHRSL